MSDVTSFGKTVLFLGLLLTGLGALLLLAGKVPFLGKLPGDLRVEREGFSFYFPLMTCLLVSVLLSLILWIVSRFK